MNTVLARFERIEILTPATGGVLPDNYWLLLHWFAGSHAGPPRAVPLHNQTGSTARVAGDTIPPFTFTCELQDADAFPVIAAFVIVELGAFPPAEQPRRANATNRRIGGLLAEAYVEATEWVAESRGIIRADAVAVIGTTLIPVRVDTIGPAFVEEARARFGRDGWPGTGVTPVLHDVVAFNPAQGTPHLVFERSYPGDGHGSSGIRAALRLILERCDHPSRSVPPAGLPLV